MNIFHRIKHLSLKRLRNIHPASLLILSFFCLIVTGAILLKFSISTNVGHLPLIDAVFTATSAVCVTGLVVVDTGSYFTIFGQCVILILIQVGGLGVMTVSVMLFKLIGKNITFKQRMAVQDVFAHSPRTDIFQLLKTIFIFTAIIELLGIGGFFIYWVRYFPVDEAFYLAVFHSISAFCNAGFSVFPDSMMGASGDWFLNVNMCLLIIMGGIGFPVIYDIYIRLTARNIKRPRLTVQTKVVLVTTIALILFGAFFFWILERTHTLSGRPFLETILVSVFQSVSCRTAGFKTIDIALLNDATLMIMTGLMFFGASPGSCGGGIKTTSLAIIVAFTVSRIRKQKHLNLFKKSIPAETVSRCVSLILLCSSLIVFVLFLLLAGNALQSSFNPTFKTRFIAYLFEAVSAFGTVGLSMGITSSLTVWGKMLIILLMFVGRVGVLTFAYIIIGGGTSNGIEYAEEDIMIG